MTAELSRPDPERIDSRQMVRVFRATQMAVMANKPKELHFRPKDRSLETDWATHYEESYEGAEDIEEVGVRAKITGSKADVVYEIMIDIFGENTGNMRTDKSREKGTLIGFGLHAREGGEGDLSKQGSIACVGSVDLDGRIFLDFGHGTYESSNPEAQEVLDQLVTYFGIEPTELFPVQDADTQLFRFDTERTERLIEGLERLAYEEV